MTIEQIVIIFQVVFPVLVAVVAVAYRFVVSKLPASQRAQATDIINHTVQAVEQTQSAVPGPNRKVQAEALINSLLKTAGVKVSPELVDVLIESAVFAVNKAVPTADKNATLSLPVVKGTFGGSMPV